MNSQKGNVWILQRNQKNVRLNFTPLIFASLSFFFCLSSIIMMTSFTIDTPPLIYLSIQHAPIILAFYSLQSKLPLSMWEETLFYTSGTSQSNPQRIPFPNPIGYFPHSNNNTHIDPVKTFAYSSIHFFFVARTHPPSLYYLSPHLIVYCHPIRTKRPPMKLLELYKTRFWLILCGIYFT